mgnify:CR=1 FL=1
MVKRCLFFCVGNEVRKITTEIPWDMGAMEVNKQMYIKQVYETALPSLLPCEEVSIASPIFKNRSLCINFIKSPEGVSIQRIWKAMDQMEIDRGTSFKPGVFEYVYLYCLTEEQVFYALHIRTFSDMFYNPDKPYHTNAIALCALQLLNKQDKLDYLEDINKFSEWFLCNIGTIREYVPERDEYLFRS